MGDSVTRREARERVIELIYEAQARDETVAQLLESQSVDVDDFVVELVTATENEHEMSLKQISEKSEDWAVSRMPMMDVIIMRVAIAELNNGSTPTGVVLSEAVKLATEYSTERSGKFVNGILSAIASDIDS